MSDKTALDVSLPTYEPSVSCGMYCLGGVVTMTETDYPEYTDAEDVFVRGDIALSALTALRARVAELEAALKDMQELAEYWINRCAEPQMTKDRYEVWLALGHRSAAMERARTALEGK